jgi:hypothetical protein
MGRARGGVSAVAGNAGVTRGGRTTWTHGRLKAALEEFLTTYDDPRGWPLASEFTDAGREDLRQAIKKRGGAVYWARVMGRELGSGQNRGPYSLDDARGDAMAVTDQLGGVPGDSRLRGLGFSRLATYFRRHGGREAVLTELGLSTAMPPPRPSVYDPVKLAQAEAAREAWAIEQACLIIGELGYLPGPRRLKALGHTRLANYFGPRGGAAAFAARHGLLP